jgi:tetratricopeptide (TPR) repeat protein
MNATRFFHRFLLLLNLAIIPFHGRTTFAADLLDSDVDSLTLQGSKLTPADAQQLETSLRQTPDDLSARTRLLGYYMRRQFASTPDRAARQQHILWIIQHHPEAPIAGLPYTELDAVLDGHVYQDAAALWKQRVADHPADPAILHNAAHYFLLHDRPTAEDLLKKGEALEPNNPSWPQALGHLYELNAHYQPQPGRQQQSAAALSQFERAYALTTEDTHKSHLLDDLAMTAFDAGDTNKAATYANQDLAFAATGKGGWNTGNAIHHGNLILGRIALQAGEIELAKHYLLEAGKTPGSPQLDSFGPNMALARELLVKGQKDVVLQYFALCAKFWKSQSELDAWTDAVKHGLIPDFGGNLIY